eukprot:335927-Chlamydomonas_euryale.AAC.1
MASVGAYEGGGYGTAGRGRALVGHHCVVWVGGKWSAGQSSEELSPNHVLLRQHLVPPHQHLALPGQHPPPPRQPFCYCVSTFHQHHRPSAMRPPIRRSGFRRVKMDSRMYIDLNRIESSRALSSKGVP